MSSSRKRKYGPSPAASHASRNKPFADEIDSPESLDPALFIQAYEADVIRGPQGRLAAQSLEVVAVEREPGSEIKHLVRKVGDGLIKWGGPGLGTLPSGSMGIFDGEDDSDERAATDDQSAVWVDRFDARLLLDTLPTVRHQSTSSSPTGWSDLPSDTEDTFFFSPDEAEDYRRDKRRRLIDQNREERLKARRAEDGDSEEEDLWGGSDEEPPESQNELMRRTAAHILSSPNPAQLEMRILANHGGDKRFAFLRGRWGRTWKVIKGRARMEKEEKEEKLVDKSAMGGLGVLAAYGDSEGESGDESVGEGKDMSAPAVVEQETNDKGKLEGECSQVQRDHDVAREARRARAKEWAEKRRALQASPS